MKLYGALSTSLIVLLTWVSPVWSHNEQRLLTGSVAVGSLGPGVIGLCRLCNCYFSSDCSAFAWCGSYSQCRRFNRPNYKVMDGTCRIWVLPWRDVVVARVADVVDLLFQTYLKAGREGGGDRDPYLFEQARAIPLPGGWHEALEEVVHTALDLALGYDFAQPYVLAPELGGSIPPLTPTASELVEAMRMGLVEAIKSDKPLAVRGPIDEFWKKNPKYVPLHVGRCYPHGHTFHPAAGTPGECQIYELQRMLEGMLQKAIK